MMASILIPLLLIGPVSPSMDSVVVPANLSISADIGPNAEGMIRDLTARLGLTVDQLMPYYQAQALVQIKTWEIGCWVGGGALLLAVIFFGIGGRSGKTEIGMMGAGVMGTIAFVCLLCICSEFSDYMTAKHNPNLWATRAMIQDAAGLIGGSSGGESHGH
jgi:hypothetical protein